MTRKIKIEIDTYRNKDSGELIKQRFTDIYMYDENGKLVVFCCNTK